ncbi:nucleoside 5-triphosphatase rdgb (dhaptp, ditp, xtp-specific) [hydrocarbon metagenome]|uniref:dITP/XTP pyrophosphatase n=1 Tax=hydrocarbon metagenome TaxID=938273 RepID=A0A0W8E778_9ZZZZ
MSSGILLATRNIKKKIELQQLLEESNIKILTLDDIKDMPEVVEDGLSFAENAIKKARETAAISGYPCLADDSGLVVDALGGEPGVFSARFAGDDADDEKNNEKLLEMMQNVGPDQRTARFICVIAVSSPDGEVETVSGVCEGRIAFKPDGVGGFGYDPLFVPQGYDQTFAELSPQIKNSISHRGRALEKCKPLLMKYLDS